MEPRRFDNWTAVRDALAQAYADLGLTMVQVAPGSTQYDPTHWNIAGLVHGLAQPKGECLHCKAPLTYSTVIRCLECRAPLCEGCAPGHFGPEHQTRAGKAHAG